MARRLTIAAILAISLGAPVAELFDRWDQPLTTGSDSEANVAVVVLCVGAVFAVGSVVVVSRIRAVASNFVKRLAPSLPATAARAFLLRPAPTVSPPVVLRV